MKIRGLISVGIFGLALLFSGCAHAPLNAPLERNATGVGYRYASLPHVKDDGVMIALFFSGGGIRASAFSYGVLKELAQTPLPGGRRLLDDVTVISSVSGGSFTAAYYCLYGNRIFQEYETVFLKRKVQGTLLRRTLAAPFARWRLLSSYYGRSDMAAELWDELLFKGATFGDLLKQNGEKRPYLVINAMNLKTGSSFPFTQDQFDLIGSNLSSFPISRAVAASSAVPVLLTPIALKNYAGETTEPTTVRLLNNGGDSVYATLLYAISQRDKALMDAAENPYIHLVDGGLADNLGLKNLMEVVAVTGGWDSLVRQMRLAGTRRLVILVVNSAITAPDDWNRDYRTPGMKAMLHSLANSSINRNNDETIELVRTGLEEWRRHSGTTIKDISIDFIPLSFKSIKDAKERVFLTSIPTRFALTDETVDRVVAAGATLLRENKDFQRLLSDIRSGR